MPTKTKKHYNTFGTNFFGVVGYICSTTVWLLIIALILAVVTNNPSPADYTYYTLQFADPSLSAAVDYSVRSSADVQQMGVVFIFLLVVLLCIVFWAFAYVASRILSRIVGRLAGLAVRKVTVQAMCRTKLMIHGIGLLGVTVLLVATPIIPTVQAAFVVLALFSGVVGVVAIVSQSTLATRYKVPFDRFL